MKNSNSETRQFNNDMELPKNKLAHIELARIVLDHTVPIKHHRDDELEFDWSGVPHSKYALAIRQRIMEIIENVGCSEGQQSGTHSLLIKQPSGLYAPSISFWIEHTSSVASNSHKLDETIAAITEFLNSIIKVPPIDTTDASQENIVIAATTNAFIEKQRDTHLAKFGGKAVPLSFVLHNPGKKVTFGGVHQTTTSASTTIQIKWVTGQIVGWHAKKKHAFIVQPTGSEKAAMTVHYIRENDDCDWRSLRLGLDESFGFQLEIEITKYKGDEYYELVSARRNSDLADIAA